jgi:hypothetical protein
MFDKKVRLNFWFQEERPFLVSSSEAQIFEFLSLSSFEGNLTDVVRDMRADLKVMSDSTKSVEGSIEATNLTINHEKDFLSRVKGFDVLHDGIMRLDAEVKGVSRLSESVGQLGRLRGDILAGRETLKVAGELLGIIQERDGAIADLLQGEVALRPLVSRLSQQEAIKDSLSLRLAGLETVLAPLELDGIAQRLAGVQEAQTVKVNLAALVQRLRNAITIRQSLVEGVQGLIHKLSRLDFTIHLWLIPRFTMKRGSFR